MLFADDDIINVADIININNVDDADNAKTNDD
jgi:hypothetical protein